MKDIFKSLKKKGFMDFGCIIPCEILQEEFEIYDFDKEYIFSLLNLKKYIEDNTDFICITRKFNIFILELEEMAGLTTKRLARALERTKQRVQSMTRVPYEELSKKDQIKHLHAIELGNRIYCDFKKRSKIENIA